MTRPTLRRALALLAVLALSLSAHADIDFRPKPGGSGGTFNGGTVSGATLFTSRVTFGSAADAVNAVDLNETANCVTFEGSSADANETRLCAINPTADLAINMPALAGTVALVSANQTWSGTQTYSQTVYFNSSVESVATTKTPSGTAEGNETYTNTGDTDGATVTLPNDPTAGFTFHFAVTVNQTLTIVPGAGESLYLGNDACAASINSNQVGATITIRAVVGGSGGVWMAFGARSDSSGTALWNCFD